jgi:sigma-B regulation protein RsbU (phosphoserine phosphatase)
MSTPAPAADRMTCMEVWGGNQPVRRHFSMPGLDVWIASRPIGDAAEGGDVYYLSSCASGRITRMLLADISGHGPAASGMAVGLRDLMRQNVNMIRQRRFVQEMNRQFAEVSQQDTFATAAVATFFAPERSLAVTNAGHPPPLIYRGADNQWELLDRDAAQAGSADDTPLGTVEQAEYSQVIGKFRTGDMALFYTDGLIETELAAGGMLGIDGLMSLARGLDVTTPERLIDDLLAELGRRSAGQPATDDVSLLLCRANGSGVGWRNNLLALGRLLRGVNDATCWRQ